MGNYSYFSFGPTDNLLALRFYTRIPNYTDSV